jgi:hypothetical protein
MVSPDDPPVSGAGTRLMWYPGKAAFRVGTVAITGNTFWNKDSIGLYSFAAGYNVKAKGNYSVALGEGTHATGNNAFSFGRSSRARGDYSTAYSFGVANGDYSTAVGATTANAIYAISMGSFTTANGYSGLVVGMHNDPIVTPQTAPGATTPLFIVGNGDNTIGQSNAMVVRKDGNVGIGTSYPIRKLHISSGTGGGQYHSDADLIIEDGNAAYLQFSTSDAQLAGILSGNNTTSIRSAIIFRLENAIDLRAGGNITRLRVESDGDINMFGGEVHRSTTGEANLLPICYGSVSSSGIILSGSGNFSVTNPSGGRYDVSITDEAYSSTTYTVSVTPVATTARMLSASAASGNLIVRFYDSAGTLTNTVFHFVVYKQ